MTALSRYGSDFRQEASSLSPGDRLCDWMVFGLAGWTLVCNIVVLLGGGLRTLVLAGFAAAGLCAALWLGLRRGASGVGVAPAARVDAEGARSSPPLGLSTRDRVGGAAASVLVVAAAVVDIDYRVLWWLAVAILGFALTRVWRAAAPIAPRQSRGWDTATWWLAALGALFPLFFHRRSLDDTYYVNVAVAAVDAPGDALLRFDTLHGIAGLPIMFPVYKLNSYELLAAAVSYLSPLTAIQAMHWVLPTLFGGFVVLGYARLLRLLTPRVWLPSLLVVLAILLSVAETTSFYSNFAFVRLHQGKCVFLSVLIPLLVVYGVRFAERPSPRAWLALAAAQIASLGLTATAIWLAPVTAALALAARLPVTLAGIRLLGIGLVASVYPLAAGLALRAAQLRSAGERGVVANAEEMLRRGTSEVLGVGPLALICWFSVLGVWCFARNRLAARLAVVFALGFLIVLYNPFIATALAGAITGQGTHFRTFWALPIPAFLAMIATAPLALRASWASAPLRIGACAVATGAFLLWVPTLHLLTQDNHVRFEPLGLNVPTREYEFARIIAEKAPPRSWVLAPEEISAWIVTFQDYPYPLMPRRLYFDLLKKAIHPSDWSWRHGMTEYVDGRRQVLDGPKYLRAAIDHFDFSVVGVKFSAWSQSIGRELSAKGYRLHHSDDVYAVWLPQAEASAQRSEAKPE